MLPSNLKLNIEKTVGYNKQKKKKINKQHKHEN